MTNKQEKILQTALQLFAEEGFSSTPTSKIAKAAGVSEGLIFRHFGNKDGLLKAILGQGEEKIKLLFSDIVFEKDPQMVVEKTLRLGLVMAKNKEEADFWKLQYKIKWEIEHYNELKVEPLETALASALNELGYEQPGQEAKFILTYLDGLAMRYFLQDNFDLHGAITYIVNKYRT